MDYYNEGGFQADALFSSYQGQTRQTRLSISPVTIKQIHDASQPVPDGDFVVNNVKLNMVSFVGVIRNVENNSSAITINVEDGTGSIDVKSWIDKNGTASEDYEKYAAMENKYVYVTGALNDFNLKKGIQHATIREVATHNEVIYHFLYAISNHLDAQGVKPEKKELFVPESGGDDKIYVAITQNSALMPEGVPVTWLSSKLGMSVEAVKDQCQQLQDAGKIYQGYDEGSFLSV